MKRYSIPASSSTSLPPNFTAPDMEEASFCPLDNIAIHEDSDSEYFDARGKELKEDMREREWLYYLQLSFVLILSNLVQDLVN